MKDDWFEDPLRGYEENARLLFGYPVGTQGGAEDWGSIIRSNLLMIG